MGSIRFHRSINLVPGVKLNVNKQSLSLTAGVRGAHATVNSKGYRTLSAGLPGSGLSYRDTRSLRSPQGAQPRQKGSMTPFWVGIGIGVVLVLAFVAMACSAPGHADDNSFVNHVHALGYQGSPSGGDADLLKAGQAVCQVANGGQPLADIKRDFETVVIPKGFTQSEADQFVTYALADLCPEVRPVTTTSRTKIWVI